MNTEFEGRDEFEWRDEYNIGVDIIDKEHRLLFNIINKMFRKNSQWACQEGIKFFKTHVVKHFEDEEAYMISIHYEGLAQHQRIHKSFRKYTLPTLIKELEQTDYAPDAIEHFMGICAGWLIGHTMTEDMAICGRGESRWQKLLSGEETDDLSKVIVQLIFDMFHLESHLVSESYGGEKFGNGVYYRLVYGTEKEKASQEVILVLEEKLLINTVGKILGITTNKLDAMLIHAARYTARQFVGRVLEHIPSAKGYELQEETLLTYDQFQKVFTKQHVQVSLLLNTGVGYLAYCTIAPYMLTDGVATPLGAENAMTEVEKYLSKREEEKQQVQDTRRKILVVDDSVTICQSMKELLKGSYNVSTATSGVAAIRTIAVNPPDLVLMDYEMPICDGRQTLEMLRSVDELADLPVVFLTGRRDPQSMIKVMPLKPAGYLLKTSKPDELKKYIDNFFAKQQAAGAD